MKEKLYRVIDSNWFYIIIGGLFLMIRISSVSVGEDANTVINEFASGGFASVLIAFLIKLKDDSYRERINKEISGSLMLVLYRNIYSFIHLPVRVMSLYDVEREESLCYREWCDITNRILERGEINASCAREYNIVIGMIDKWFSRYEEKKDWLLLEDVLTKDERQFIDDIKKVYGPIMLFGIYENLIDMNFYRETQDKLIEVLSKYDITKGWCSMKLDKHTQWRFSDFYQ